MSNEITTGWQPTMELRYAGYNDDSDFLRLGGVLGPVLIPKEKSDYEYYQLQQKWTKITNDGEVDHVEYEWRPIEVKSGN